MDLSSAHAADFRGHTRTLQLGEVTVRPSSVQPLVAGAAWSGSEAEYRPYDMHSQNSSQPCTVWVGRDERVVKSVGVEIPEDLLSLPRKSADRAADGPRLGTVLADLASALFPTACAHAEPALPSDGDARCRRGRLAADPVAAGNRVAAAVLTDRCTVRFKG